MTSALAPTPATGERSSRWPLSSRLLTILYILLCFEVGLLIFFFPWTPFWTRNFFVIHYPWLGAVARNDFFRGAVSGTGLADVWLGIYEIAQRRRARPSPNLP